jgi:hypothetical protein
MKHRKDHWNWLLAAPIVGGLIVWFALTPADGLSPEPNTGVGQVVTCSVDVNSGCTIQHGLGMKPTSVTVTVGGRGQLASVPANQITETSFRVNFNWHTGVRFATGTGFTFQVHYDLPAASTPPPPSPTPTPPPTTPPPSPTPTPTEPGTSPVLACTSPTFTTISDDNIGDGRTVSGPGGPYFIHNNMWNNHDGAGPTGTYRMDLCDPYDNWKETWTQQPSTVSPGAVRAYPNIHKDYSDISVSSIYAARFAHNTTKVAGHIWNVAFDSWITCNGNDFGGELMIWTENHNQTPAGTKLSGTVTIGGQAYEVWKSNGLTNKCGIFTYRSVNTQTHGTMPLQDFYNDLKARGWIDQTATSWQVDYGIETVSTAGAQLVTNFNDFEIFDVTNPGAFASVPTSQRFAAEEKFESDKPHPASKLADAHKYQKAKGWR